jgi:hypothetical protein
MNLTQQHLPLANSLAGLALAESLVPRLFKPQSESTVASLQRDQPVSIKVVRVIEPAVIKDLRAMREEERNSDAPITPRAFSVAMSLLEFAHRVFDLPRTLLVPSGEGGITIEWFREDHTVRVIIPPRPDQAAYIYQRVGRESDIKPFSKSSVIQTLRAVILT